MAKLTVGQKAQRVVKLLLGLRQVRIAEALRQYGFTQKDLDEGWRRLSALTEGRLSVRAPARQDPRLLEQLDAWENRWFPVASASLRANFPAAHEFMFLNLKQTQGAEVVMSVGTFVQRYERLATEPSLGAEGAAARALLEARGLDAVTVQGATKLLEQLTSMAESEPAPQPDPAQQARAEAEMWSWYLEWGEIARVAISDRRLLRDLGFLSSTRPAAREPSEAEAAQEEELSPEEA